MLKRTLFFSNPYHLSVKNQQLIITNKETGEIRQAPIEDLGFVILENPQITLTIKLVQELAENNVAVVFCDSTHLPASMLLNLNVHHLQSELFGNQVRASEPLKKQLWKQTIIAKIKNQAAILKRLGKDYLKLTVMAQKVVSGDATNREAQASRIYWHELFEGNFSRARFGTAPNNALNYGYAILRAAVARSLVGSGLLPTLGIHHHNKYNAFCLADDIMEPYRPYVDLHIVTLIDKKPFDENLSKENKADILQILTTDVVFENTKRPLMVGISQTTASLAKCFSGELKKIAYPEI